jgi:PleD family two-component response regulator
MGRNDPNGLLRALVHGADVAMYQAKRNGGNQSRLYDGPVDLPEP